MTTSINPQIRLIALVGLLVAAALVVSTQLVLRGMIFSGESKPAAVPASVAGTARNAEPATEANAADAANAENAAATSTPATAGNRNVTTKRPLRTHGLPMALAQTLQRHDVVVVSLFTRNAAVDRLARAEAAAGAKQVAAGFVALNVRRRANSEPLATKLGVLNSPSVLVYTRPAKLFVKLDGFADLATVAQAAANAGS